MKKPLEVDDLKELNKKLDQLRMELVAEADYENAMKICEAIGTIKERVIWIASGILEFE